MIHPVGTPLSEVDISGVVSSGRGVCPEIMSRMGYQLNRVPQDPGATSPMTSQPETPKATWAPMLSA
jgi:hypothetical protein